MPLQHMTSTSNRVLHGLEPSGLDRQRFFSPDIALTEYSALAWLNAVSSRLSQSPTLALDGRGIVICAGGPTYTTCAWVCVNLLRMHECRLPIELWYLGRQELPVEMEQLFRPLGVTCIDAKEIQKVHPARILNGWELKPYAMLRSRFAEVLLLDADNVAVRDPEFLFDAPEYLTCGAAFWPDYGRLKETDPIWRLTGVSYRDEPEFETAQICVDKRRCWGALTLTMSINEFSDFWYRYIHGDKDTFHLAWRKLDIPYAMTSTPIYPLHAVMCQHDFTGKRLFQHRHLDKWSLRGNYRVDGFQFEGECLTFLEALRPGHDKV